MKVNIKLIIIVLIALVLRLYNLSSIPVGFNDDEAAFGYNAYSIAKTGHDEWGRLLPFPAFESFGDWKLVGLLYPTLITTAIFGLNEFSTRLPSVLFGTAAVVATYLLAKELFGRRIALTAALLLAISPWHIVASRNAFESDILTFAITLSTYLFLKGLKSKKFLTLSTISFAICFYIYRSGWLFLPLFLLMLSFLYRSELIKYKTFVIKNFVLFCVLLLPLVPVVLTFQGQSRFIQESFISGVARSGIDNRLNEMRGVCQEHIAPYLCTIYNKYFLFLTTYLQNYGRNLSFQTYFDTASPTGFQSFATRSVFYLFEFPLIFAGIALLLITKSREGKLLIFWVLLAPVGASFTGADNYGRINLIMPAPQIITAAALVTIILFFKSKKARLVAISLTIVIVLISVYKLTTDMLFIEPFYTSRFQRYGYKDLFSYLSSQEASYDNFYISKKVDNSHQYIQYVYFQKIDPSFFQKNSIKPRGEDGWIEFEKIGKYHFVTSLPKQNEVGTKALFVTPEKELGITPKHVIRDLRGDIIFEIHEAKLQ